jgi:hypothetical protein
MLLSHLTRDDCRERHRDLFITGIATVVIGFVVLG